MRMRVLHLLLDRSVVERSSAPLQRPPLRLEALVVDPHVLVEMLLEQPVEGRPLGVAGAIDNRASAAWLARA